MSRNTDHPLLKWLGWITGIVVIVTLLVLFYHHMERREQERTEMANTKIVFVDDPVEQLVRRVDGSYYDVSYGHAGGEHRTTYDYTTVDENGVVVQKSASTQVADGHVLWMTAWNDVDVKVRVIDPEDDDQRPRVEAQRCTVKPIDPSKPSYTGDLHARRSLPIGSRKESDHTPGLKQLCVDRVTIFVQDGTVQP
ncbi:hypothetical protein [Streptomyces sp. MMS24-I29]|uniref:hypothetical protein n=1 Tax=Streptomyces sp. MMS24-I29 TaxID=3351480 RepID=UPI003C7AF5F0